MRKLRLIALLTIMLLTMFATTAFAQPDLDNSDGLQNGAIAPVTVEPVNDNANQTGVGTDAQNNFDTVINNVYGHKTHGSYQSNTNSCASCHQTHTAKTGSRLLFADTVYKTCVACHDGTLGFYNVFETGANAHLDGAGTFGGALDNNMSVHMANNSLKINAAPGGSKAASGVWNAQFSCASCHTPHGSHSDRLLHYNPNGFATNPQVTAGNNTFGNYYQNLSVVDAAYVVGSTSPKFVLKKGDDGAGFVKIKLYKWVDKGATANPRYVYEEVKSPWAYGYASHTGPHYTRLFAGTDTTANSVWYGQDTTNIYVSYKDGYIKALTTAGNDKLNTMTGGHVSLPYIVKMDLTVVDADRNITKNNQAAYWDGFMVGDREAEFLAAGYTVTAGKATGLGVKMNQYCATCHTDYFTSRSNSGGTYFGADGKAAQRHSTTSDRFSCVRCHYAHGTDAEIMIDAAGNTVEKLVTVDGLTQEAALAKMLDKNPSSALKKYTNMSVCWACHGSSSRATSFKNGGNVNPTAMPIVDGVQR